MNIHLSNMHCSSKLRSGSICKSREARNIPLIVRASSEAIDVTDALVAPPQLGEMDMMQLGKSEVRVPVLGVGAWSWGDKSGYWGYDNKSFGESECRDAYKAIHSYFGDSAFIDTAEVYGFGKSEELIGQFRSETSTNPMLATKFAPQPFRQSSDCVVKACRESLARLKVDKVALYIQHWPGFLLNSFSNEAYLDGFVRVKEEGLADAIGVSNFNASRVRSASRRLQAAGIPLSSNQVQYSLLYRAPEFNGVYEACKENGVTIVAYSPMAQGLLTGKFGVGGSKPVGPRSFFFTESRIKEIQPLLAVLKIIADTRDKTMAQVALNWCICKGTLPIPGVKNEVQLREVVGALGWRLSDGEMSELDSISAKIPSSTGAPFENW